MLYYLFGLLAERLSVFHVFRYITFRALCVLFTTFLISFLLGLPTIRWLRSFQTKGQPIREDGPEGHLLHKQGTPTMGGGLMLLSIGLGTLLWADLGNSYIWLVLGAMGGFGLLGAIDDYKKLSQNNSKGVSGRAKLLVQIGISCSVSAAIMWLSPTEFSGVLTFPFFKNAALPLGILFPLFACFVIVGASNAVNLTDGLDGLAIGPIMISMAVFFVIAYVTGHIVFSRYLQLPYIPGSSEVAIICAAVIGAGLGFLWYNAPPALVFMGDTGSLAMGGCLGTVSVLTKHEIVLAIVGGVFVIEAISVIVQVLYYKKTRKRIFLMAPIHHHFEKKGWAEPTIVFRFWILAILCALVGLSTLKLR